MVIRGRVIGGQGEYTCLLYGHLFSDLMHRPQSRVAVDRIRTGQAKSTSSIGAVQSADGIIRANALFAGPR